MLFDKISYGANTLISKNDIKLMPVTFIIAPILLIALTVIMVNASSDIVHEKSFIASLSCPELIAYIDSQTIESKLYFGSENYMIFAEERLNNFCWIENFLENKPKIGSKFDILILTNYFFNLPSNFLWNQQI